MGVQKGRRASGDKKKQCLLYRKRISGALASGVKSGGLLPRSKEDIVKQKLLALAAFNMVYANTWQTEVDLLIESGLDFVSFTLDN